MIFTKMQQIVAVFNPNLSGLFSGSFWGPTSPCLKLIRFMLEASNLARKYTPVCRFKNYTF